MLAVLNNTVFDTRTDLEKKLDDFIKKKNFENKINYVDKFIGNLSKIQYKKMVIMTACFLFLSPKTLVFAIDMSRITIKGKELITALRVITSMLIAGHGMIETTSGIIAKEDKKFFTNIFFKYVIVMAMLYFFPRLYEFVEDIFR